jgi:hypothetical protein
VKISSTVLLLITFPNLLLEFKSWSNIGHFLDAGIDPATLIHSLYKAFRFTFFISRADIVAKNQLGLLSISTVKDVSFHELILLDRVGNLGASLGNIGVNAGIRLGKSMKLLPQYFAFEYFGLASLTPALKLLSVRPTLHLLLDSIEEYCSNLKIFIPFHRETHRLELLRVLSFFNALHLVSFEITSTVGGNMLEENLLSVPTETRRKLTLSPQEFRLQCLGFTEGFINSFFEKTNQQSKVANSFTEIINVIELEQLAEIHSAKIFSSEERFDSLVGGRNYRDFNCYNM